MAFHHDQLYVVIRRSRRRQLLRCSTHPQSTDHSIPRILRNTRLTAGALVQGLLGLDIFKTWRMKFRARKACRGPTGRPLIFTSLIASTRCGPAALEMTPWPGHRTQEKRVDAKRQGLGRGNPRTKTGVSTPPVRPYLPHKPGVFNHGCREDGV
jgi:hypothetical protein